jgi:futalosine hydrolase
MESDILLVVATRDEVSDLLEISKINSEALSSSNKTIISAAINSTSYDLIITGPSVFNAAHALTIALEKRKPKIIIQAGIAGVFKESNLNIGDITIATEERYIHAGVEKAASYETPDNLPFELIDKISSTESGCYHLDKKYIEKTFQVLSNSRISNECRISKGPVITVSTITSEQTTASNLYKTFSPNMEAMEGAASAHVASLYNVPFLEIRSGSNYVGQRDKNKWNIPLAKKRISQALSSIIQNINPKYIG